MQELQPWPRTIQRDDLTKITCKTNPYHIIATQSDNSSPQPAVHGNVRDPLSEQYSNTFKYQRGGQANLN